MRKSCITSSSIVQVEFSRLFRTQRQANALYSESCFEWRQVSISKQVTVSNFTQKQATALSNRILFSVASKGICMQSVVLGACQSSFTSPCFRLLVSLGCLHTLTQRSPCTCSSAILCHEKRPPMQCTWWTRRRNAQLRACSWSSEAR